MNRIASKLWNEKSQFRVEVLLYEISPDSDELQWYNLTDEDLLAVDEWVVSNKLGERKSYNIWKLKSTAAVTMFLLKWNI